MLTPSLEANLAFDAIGVPWQIDTREPLQDHVVEEVRERIGTFDRTYSRFRRDSLVSHISITPGSFVFPPDAAKLFDLYGKLYAATDGAVSPLVGQALETLGYDRSYSLRQNGVPVPVVRWDEAFAWDGVQLSTVRPVLIDVGAAGKGYLVDIVAEILARNGVSEYVVDASGDMVHAGLDVLRVGLEHPLDTTKAIGIVELKNASLCASATNRRSWGEGLHHVIDATTGLPTRNILATWAIAATALEADGLATALFFADGARLEETFEFDWVRMFADGRVERSAHLSGELFT
jgi:FAD:protein FMN transferase